jgi:MFS family permease
VAVVANLVAVGGLALLALAGWAGNVSLLLPAIALFGLSAVGRSAGEALVGESARGRRVGYAYGQVSFAWAVAGVLASLGSGFLAERLGFAPVLAVTAAIETVGVLLLVLLVRETLQGRRPARLAPVDLRRLALGLLVPPAGLRMLYLAVVVDVFSYGLASQLIFGFLADRFGFTPVQFGIMNTVFSLAWAAAQLPAGRWVDRGRAREMLVLSEILNAAAIGLWLVSSEFVAFVASMAVLGLVSALWSPAILSWVYERVPTARRAEELGRLSAVPGLFGFPAPYLGGLLYDRLGFAVPVALNLVGALLAGALLAWGLRRGGGEGEQNVDGS